jgi:ribosomal-protein-alanine N-acetyltransferase
MGKPLIPIHMRWAIRRDLGAILAIERKSFVEPWTEEDFLRWLKLPCNIALVAEYDDETVGYVFYQLHRSNLEICNFAVHPLYRRLGVGEAMIDKLTKKLSPYGRQRLLADVSECNTPMHLFLRSQGFRAVRTLRKRFFTQDAYRFVWVHPDAVRVRLEEGAMA